MPDPSTLALFTAASLALVITPGPAVLYVTLGLASAFADPPRRP